MSGILVSVKSKVKMQNANVKKAAIHNVTHILEDKVVLT